MWLDPDFLWALITLPVGARQQAKREMLFLLSWVQKLYWNHISPAWGMLVEVYKWAKRRLERLRWWHQKKNLGTVSFSPFDSMEEKKLKLLVLSGWPRSTTAHIVLLQQSVFIRGGPLRSLNKPLRIKPQQNILVTKSADLEGKEMRDGNNGCFLLLAKIYNDD